MASVLLMVILMLRLTFMRLSVLRLPPGLSGRSSEDDLEPMPVVRLAPLGVARSVD
jgi:hypothetical protein